MLNSIKSNDIQIIILEYIKQNRILDIFKYSKYHQIKFNLTKEKYLSYFFNKIPDSLENIMDNYDENSIFEEIKKYTTNHFSNDTLKKNLIYYCAKKNEFILSLDNIFFDEIINEKILLNKKANIKFGFREYLSLDDIIHLKNGRKSYAEIGNYLNEIIKKYNVLITKLELLLNTEIFIEEIFFDIIYQIINKSFIIDNNKDIIENIENITNEEKNILINFKIKRAELINKILEKHCKNIKKLDYIILDKKNIDISIRYPLLHIEKFVNLKDLNLFILYNSQKSEHIFEFNYNLEKLKHLKITGHINTYNILSYYPLSLYIKKEILDELETIKIKKVRWFVLNNEYFHFKNLKNMNIEFFQYNNIINTNSKKYFHEELLNGNINWEKLERLKINIPFYNNRINKTYKNKEIRDFINIANVRKMHDSSFEFYQEFFKFIFKNQILYIKTNKENKAIDNFIIKIYDNFSMIFSGFKPTIKYEKKLKIVKITLEGILYCSNFLHVPVKSPLSVINLSNIKMDPNLDGFFIDNYTLDQFKKINELILSLEKNIEDGLKEYKQISANREIEKELKIKYINEINDKIETFNKKVELLSQDNNSDTFEKKLSEIQKLILLRAIDGLKKMKQIVSQMEIKENN